MKGINSKKLKYFLIFFILFNSIIGIFAIFISNDASFHALIVDPVIKTQIYPLNYQPISDIKFTYPILFHYISYFFVLIGIPSLFSVKFVGYIAFVLFPICIYLLGSLFNKRIAIYSTIISTLITSVTIIAIFGEFPQLLSFDLFVLFIFFYFKKRYKMAGILLGLTILSHVFTGLFAILSVFILLLIFRNRDTLKTIGIAFLVSLFWLYQYIQIINNALFGRWGNITNYSDNLGFISLKVLLDNILKFNPFIFVFSITGLIYFFYLIKFKKEHKKELFFSILYLICFIFIIYHLPITQYKINDIFTIPLTIISAIGFSKIINKFKFKNAFILLILLLFLSLFNPIWIVSKYHNMGFFLDKPTIEAANFLREYDPSFSMILITYEARGWGETERIFSQLARKIPMDASMTVLEAYTKEYTQRLIDREAIIRGDYGLVKKYKIRYIISKEDLLFDKIYDREGVKIYKT